MKEPLLVILSKEAILKLLSMRFQWSYYKIVKVISSLLITDNMLLLVKPRGVSSNHKSKTRTLIHDYFGGIRNINYFRLYLQLGWYLNSVL